MCATQVGRTVLLLAALVAALTVSARALDPTPEFGSTKTEIRALRVAEGHLATGYTLPPDEFRKAQRKARINDWLHFGGEAWGIVQLLLLLRLGGIAWMQGVAVGVSRNRWVQGLVFVGMLLLAGALLDLPLGVVGHQVARVYGLSVQGWGSWSWDQTKGFLLGWLIGWPIVMLLFWVIRRSPTRWWLWFWGATIPMVLLGVFLVPLVIEPMFNHFEPLAKADPALVAQLQRVVDKGHMGITPDRMFLMKASEKVTGMNAYVTGFGGSKRVVVWDTTIAKATPDEILFIFGHEMGHWGRLAWTNRCRTRCWSSGATAIRRCHAARRLRRLTIRGRRGMSLGTSRGSLPTSLACSCFPRSREPCPCLELSRRPAHGPASEQVKVQMLDRLPAVHPRVYDQPVAVCQALLPCQVSCYGKQMAHQPGVLRHGMRMRRKVLLGDDQEVDRRLRVDVRKGQAHLVFKDSLCRNRSRNNLAEQTVGRHALILPAGESV